MFHYSKNNVRRFEEEHASAVHIATAIKHVAGNFGYQMTDAFLKSTLFIVALQMNNFLTSYIDNGSFDFWPLGFSAIFMAISMALTSLRKTYLELYAAGPVAEKEVINESAGLIHMHHELFK